MRSIQPPVGRGALIPGNWFRIREMRTRTVGGVNRRPLVQRLLDSTGGDVCVALLAMAAAFIWGAHTVAGRLLIIAASLTLLARRHAPIVVLGLTTVCAAGYVSLDRPGPETVPAAVALYTAAALGHRAVASGTAALAAGAVLAVRPGSLPTVGAWLLTVVVTGELTRSRLVYLAYVEQRVAEAEHTREQEARRRVAEERLRIAREVHDVVGHHVSLINVQAGAALLRGERRPELVRPALVAIKRASHETLVELRATLGVLRGEPARLPDLIEGARAAGLTVSYSGTDAILPPAVSLAAYRTVQEALTNVTRHAGPCSVRVIVTHGEKLVVSIVDDGTVAAGFTPGNGLRGMRERVEALGGTLSAGPIGSGFQVTAELPL
jgi:signal transduction histidine kinase